MLNEKRRVLKIVWFQFHIWRIWAEHHLVWPNFCFYTILNLMVWRLSAFVTESLAIVTDSWSLNMIFPWSLKTLVPHWTSWNMRRAVKMIFGSTIFHGDCFHSIIAFFVMRKCQSWDRRIIREWESDWRLKVWYVRVCNEGNIRIHGK